MLCGDFDVTNSTMGLERAGPADIVGFYCQSVYNMAVCVLTFKL